MIICSVRDGSIVSTAGTANCANARFGGLFCAVVTTAPPQLPEVNSPRARCAARSASIVGSVTSSGRV